MLYKDLEFTKNDSGMIFGNKNFKLHFGIDGELKAIEHNGKVYNSDKIELKFTLNGKYRSTLDMVNINKNWAGLSLENADTVECPSEYLSHKLVKTDSAVELQVLVRIGQLEVNKIYRISSDRSGFTRSFEITNRGEKVIVRKMFISLVQFDGFAPAIRTAHPGFLTNGSETVAAWFDPRKEKCGFDANLNANLDIQNELENGESLKILEIEYDMFCENVLNTAKAVSRNLEAVGLRVHRENEELIRSLVCYEVEIGPLKLSESKCHHRYDHPIELANDLERIKSFGFNTIELMPSFLFPCYTVYDLKNPDIQHGAGESIRPIIERAHELGMKVILDVLMHGCIDTEIADFDKEHYSSRRYYWPEWQKKIPELVGVERGRINPLREEHPDWFIYENPNEIFKCYTWIFDHTNRGFQEYFAEAMEISVRDWGVDGFRFDAPEWGCGVNSADDLPYSHGSSLNRGHCELFRRTRERIDDIKPNIVFIVETPYYQYADQCDASYSYDMYFKMKTILENNMNISQMQHHLEMRQKTYPTGSLWLNFADNHDTWNNGVIEDGLYSYERFGLRAAKALFTLDCFVDGGIQAFAGCEDGEEYGRFVKNMLSTREKLQRFIYHTEADYSVYPSDERLMCIVRRDISNSENIKLVLNFSADVVECDIQDIGRVKFEPYEFKLWLNSNEFVICAD